MASGPVASPGTDDMEATTVATERKDEEAAQKDKDEEAAQKDKEDEDFERSVHIAQITARDFVKMIGVNWKNQKIKRLDFSADIYKLESLQGLLENIDQTRRSYLTILDFTDNRLNSIDCLHNDKGFDCLVTLIARRNMISEPRLHLKRLIELNLAHNNLTLPPDLDGLPCLEVLVLSHNKLIGSFQAFKAGHRIKHLDISFNEYECSPSQLKHGLKYLNRMKNLQTLRMHNNPFINYFPEYEIFVAKELTTLTKLDNMKITRTMRKEIAASKVSPLECYDDHFKERKAEKEKADRNKDQDRTVLSFPRLIQIQKWLDEIFDNPGVLQKNVMKIQAEAESFNSLIHRPGNRGGGEIDENLWNEIKPSQCEAYAKRTVEMIVSIIERHESVRNLLIEVLGRLTAACKHDLGKKCVNALARILSGNVRNELERKKVSSIFLPFVLRNVETFIKEDPCGEQSEALISGINDMLASEESREVLSGMMTGLLESLIKWITSSSNISEGPHIVKLVAHLTEDKNNAKEFSTMELVQRCVDAVDNKSIAESERSRDFYSDILNLAENLIESGGDGDEVIERFFSKGTHFKVIARVQNSSDGQKLEEPSEADLMSKIFNFLAAMMKRKKQVLHDCCDSFHIIEIIQKILLRPRIHPKILESATKCLTVILEDIDMYRKNGVQIVEHLQLLVPFLDFLGGKRYADLFQLAMKTEDSDDEDEMVNKPETPPLTHMSNRDVCGAFLGVIMLIAFFARSGDDEDQARKMVNDAMEHHHREQVLLRLLLVPKDEIKIAVMECILETPVDQISTEEMGMVIQAFAAFRNIGEGQAEAVLSHLVRLLKKLVEAENTTGDDFRKGYAPVAIQQVYETLLRNSERDTHNNEQEEEEKLVLSRSIVDFLRSCSQIASLRKCLRSPELRHNFPQIMKNEEILHRANAKDVCLEQTWIGRSLENLMLCLKGNPKLLLERKQKLAFRVLSRAADILEGITDIDMTTRLDSGRDWIQRPVPIASLEMIRDKEMCMFKDRATLEKNHRYLDRDEWEDRKREAITFVKSGNLQFIREYISGLKVEEEVRKQLAMTWDMRQALGSDGSSIDEVFKVIDDPSYATSGQRALGIEGPLPDGSDGHEALMYALQRYEDSVEENKRSLFPVYPKELEFENELFANVKEKTMHSTWAVAAYLRILYSLVVVPPTDECFEIATRELLSVETQVRLRLTVEQVPCLACNVVAKLLRLNQVVIRSIAEAAILNEKVMAQGFLTYRSMTDFAAAQARKIMVLLRMTTERSLEDSERVLGLECARFTSAVLASVPHFVRKRPTKQTEKEEKEAQTQKIVSAFVSDLSIRMFIQIALHELQMDAGGGRREDVTGESTREMWRRLSLREEATKGLIWLLVLDESKMYTVLEHFSDAEIFEKQTVRQSYLDGILQDVCLGRFRVFCEEELRKKAPDEDKHHHIIRFEMADVLELDKAGSTPSLSIFCATSQKLYILAPNREVPPSLVNDRSAVSWEPSWEVEDPKNPSAPRFPAITFGRDYGDIQRIYKLFGTQMMAIHWKPLFMNDEGQKVARGKKRKDFDGTKYFYCNRSDVALSNGKKGTCSSAGGPRCHSCHRFRAQDEASAPAAITLICFHKSGVLDECASLLRRHSADAEHERVQIRNDPSTKNAVQETSGHVLAATVGMLADATSTRSWWGKATGGSAQYLFVLTDKKIEYYTINMAAWSLPDEKDINFDEHEFVPKRLSLQADDAKEGMEQHERRETYLMEQHFQRLVDGDMDDHAHGPALALAPAADMAPTRIFNMSGAKERSCGFGATPAAKKASAVAAGKMLVREEKAGADLPFQEVIFEYHPKPELTLKCANKPPISIRFYDDAAREHWRRALADIFTQDEKKCARTYKHGT